LIFSLNVSLFNDSKVYFLIILAFLLVPPKWIITPLDTDAIIGQNVLIDCQATGYPQPQIWWEHAKAIDSSPAQYQPVISNSHVYTLENGTLIIKESSRKDDGYYLCHATNGIGSGISKVIKITVHGWSNF